MKIQYDERTDAVVYGCPATATFTPADWVRLALAALSQADVTPSQLATAYGHARGPEKGKTERTLNELDLLPEETR